MRTGRTPACRRPVGPWPEFAVDPEGRESPALALGLICQLFRSVLGVGDEAVAADAHQLHRIAEVVIQPAELGLHMLHKGAMGAKHHQQHRTVVQRLAIKPAARDLGQIKTREACAERQHCGWCQGHDVRADGANLLQDDHLRC